MKIAIKKDVNPDNLLTEEEIRTFIFSGCLYEYESYDHRKAVGEQLLAVNPLYYNTVNLQYYDIQYDLKEKYKIRRIGKLRTIRFAPDGSITTMHIGNKRAKCFLQYHMGKEVKPIIHPMDDNLNLIGRGLAISSIKE